MLIAHHHPAHARAIAVIAACADAGDVGQPARLERPGTVGHGEREAVHDVRVASVRQGLSHGVFEEDERPPQASEATVEGTLREQGRQERPQVLAHIAPDTALAFPWHTAAPWGRQTQAEQRYHS